MTSITQDELISKFKKTDISIVFEFTKISDQILWVLKKIKTDFKIDEYIPSSILSNILIDCIGISCTVKRVSNTLNPIKKKFHKKSIDGEPSFKIMQAGIDYVEKLSNQISTKSHGKLPSKKSLVDDSIKQIHSLRDKKEIAPGLYYIVFIDLTGSSVASSKIGPEQNKERIDHYISLTQKALPKKPLSLSVFIKPIGDGALFLFSNFEDIKTWTNEVERLCDEYNIECITNDKPEIFQMYSKVCVHLGEIHFNDNLDPIAFAVNQLFKIEKAFQKAPFGVTDVVKQVIIPRINSGELEAEKIDEVTLIGENIPRPIWNIAYR